MKTQIPSATQWALRGTASLRNREAAGASDFREAFGVRPACRRFCTARGYVHDCSDVQKREQAPRTPNAGAQSVSPGPNESLFRFVSLARFRQVISKIRSFPWSLSVTVVIVQGDLDTEQTNASGQAAFSSAFAFVETFDDCAFQEILFTAGSTATFSMTIDSNLAAAALSFKVFTIDDETSAPVEIDVSLTLQASGPIAQTHDVTHFADALVVAESRVRTAAVTGTVLVNGYNSTPDPSGWFSNEIDDSHTATIITVTKQ